MSPGGDRAKEARHADSRLRRYRQATDLGAFQGHDLPAELAHVACIARLIAPASADMLRLDRVANCLTDPLTQAWIARHRIGLAEGKRRDAVAIHGREQLGFTLQAAACRLTSQEELQTVLDVLAIGTVEMRVPRPQKSE